MGKLVRCFDCPVSVRLQAVPLPTVVQHQGQHSACDVWLQYDPTPDAGGIATSAWTLSAVNGSLEVVIATVNVADAPATTIGGGTAGLRSVRLFTVRGVPCDGFVLRSNNVTGDVDIILEAFGDGDGGGAAPEGGTTTLPTDALANPTSAAGVVSFLMGFSGATWARLRAGVVAVESAFTGFLNGLPYGRYVAARPVLADGEGAALPLSSAGYVQGQEMLAPAYEDNTNAVAAVAQKPAVLATYAWTRYLLQNAVSGTIKASAGNLASLHVTNENAAVRFLMLFDKASAPIAADVPVLIFRIPIGTFQLIGEDFFGPNGSYFATGIAWGITSTDGNYVVAGPAAADHTVCAMYK